MNKNHRRRYAGFLRRRKFWISCALLVGCGNLPDSVQPSSSANEKVKTWIGTYDVTYDENHRFCGNQLTGSDAETVEAHVYASSIPRELVFARGIYHDVVTKTADVLFGTKTVTVDKLDINNRQYTETTYYSVRLSGKDYVDIVVRSETVSGLQDGGCKDVIQEIRGSTKKVDDKNISCVERDPPCKENI